jgi:hypothetical protein
MTEKLNQQYLLGPWELHGMTEDLYIDIAHTYPELLYSEEDLERFEQERTVKGNDADDAVNRAFEELMKC